MKLSDLHIDLPLAPEPEPTQLIALDQHTENIQTDIAARPYLYSRLLPPEGPKTNLFETTAANDSRYIRQIPVVGLVDAYRSTAGCVMVAVMHCSLLFVSEVNLKGHWLKS